ncbi:VOC family protein (plasmid) [Rhizobium sp. CB3060]|uniref:VOC family protein n=1 Tax=Rhizobium sp. CB3060 TaxID=3138255 RepID=UPI0021A37BC9|nr:VOC family protein [Rhizobium tropici]UWU25929.1 VOC family protein [Rhizobium tropici]
MNLRLELFVASVRKSADFYCRFLGFQISGHSSDGYTKLINGDAVIGINSVEALGQDHPLYAHQNERLGRGVEIVLSVDDVDFAYEVARKEQCDVSDLASRPWGLRDFRVTDPDGYYIRVTSR